MGSVTFQIPKKLGKLAKMGKFREKNWENKQKWENIEKKTRKISKNGNSEKNTLLKSLTTFSR